MKIDLYDTYATAPNGTLMHFHMMVPAGVSRHQVLTLIHALIGGDEPEIEAEHRGAGFVACHPTVRDSLHTRGYHISPVRSGSMKAA
jgi:hypothetical protein